MKRNVENVLCKCLEERHWKFMSLCSLPRAFVRNTPVTPVFMARVLGKWKNVCQVDGYIGMVYRKFEQEWLKRSGGLLPVKGKKQINRFCLMLHIANFREVSDKGYIHTLNGLEEVEGFCSIVGAILERMPHDERSLAEVFARDELLGFSLEKFVIYGQDEKFGELSRFIGQTGRGKPLDLDAHVRGNG